MIDKSYFPEMNTNINDIFLEQLSWLHSIFFSPLKLEREIENGMAFYFLKFKIPNHILHKALE